MISSILDDKTTARLDDYAPLIGCARVDQLRLMGEGLQGRTIDMVGAGRFGGGAAEVLGMIPLLNELGILTAWEVLEGDPDFLGVTDAISHGLQGAPCPLTAAMRDRWEAVTARNIKALALQADCVIIHDHQPIGLIAARRPGRQNWLWRCHADLSAPDPVAWEFIAPYLRQYDGAIMSAPSFARQAPVPQFLIPPSINPFSEKNRELSRSFIRQVLHRFGIEEGRPLLTQISRFDRLKDPSGVVATYRSVKKRHDCQLVLAGERSADDPETDRVLDRLREDAGNDPDVHILELPPSADLEINALQRASTVILQTSPSEGSALTVTDALFKKKPVVAGAAGGTALQVIHGVTGMVVHSVEGAAYQISWLLDHPDLARNLGRQGYRHVCEHFLLTRHVQDYLAALIEMRERTAGRKAIILKDGTGRR